MRKQLQEEIHGENSKQTQAESLKEEFERLKQINLEYYAQAAAFQSTFEKLERLKSQKTMLENNRRHILDGMTEMSGELQALGAQLLSRAETTDELGNMLKNFDSHLKSIEAKKSKQVDFKEKEEGTVEDLRRRERNLATTQGGLVANRKVRQGRSQDDCLTFFVRLTREMFVNEKSRYEKLRRLIILLGTTTHRSRKQRSRYSWKSLASWSAEPSRTCGSYRSAVLTHCKAYADILPG